MNGHPTISQAIILWQESLSGVIKTHPTFLHIQYISHTTGVAESAYKIAQKCNLDPEKAYILGLLHDYGKIQNEVHTGKTHFIVGYDEMMNKGFDGVANICLSHSFPSKDFSFSNYISYNIKDLERAKRILSEREYDDYDRLIQLCDMFFEGINRVSYQERIDGICKRYNLTKEQVKDLEDGAKANKEYFDNLCNQDIYEILNIKN